MRAGTAAEAVAVVTAAHQQTEAMVRKVLSLLLMHPRNQEPCICLKAFGSSFMADE
jgi:hypothetical protein